MSELALSTNPTTPSFYVKITQGPNKGDVYKISPPGVIVGRDPSASQITLFDARVSRQQCRIDFIDDIVMIEDLSGKSSTQINGAAITQHELRHGDVITMGDSSLVFEVGYNTPKLALAGGLGFTPTQGPRPSINTQSAGPALDPQKKRLLIIAAVGLLAVVGLTLYPDAKKAGPMQVKSPEELNMAIEEVQKRQEELQKPTSNLTEQQLYNKRSAEKHFIRGFRDYQNGKYTRAIEAFQTTLATDPKHIIARRYYKLAEKKRQDTVDYHMDLGNKYHEKSMYKLCIAEFEKVLQIINQPSHKKYQLAKEQIKECRLSLQGRF